MAHLLRALSNGPYWYSVCAAEPETVCSHDQADCEECGTGIYHERGLKPDLYH